MLFTFHHQQAQWDSSYLQVRQEDTPKRSLLRFCSLPLFFGGGGVSEPTECNFKTSLFAFRDLKRPLSITRMVTVCKITAVTILMELNSQHLVTNCT